MEPAHFTAKSVVMERDSFHLRKLYSNLIHNNQKTILDFPPFFSAVTFCNSAANSNYYFLLWESRAEKQSFFSRKVDGENKTIGLY